MRMIVLIKMQISTAYDNATTTTTIEIGRPLLFEEWWFLNNRNERKYQKLKGKYNELRTSVFFISL